MDAVRVDKYLWAIRVFKTRTDATEACKGSKITVNGADIKPSKEVKAGDVIQVRKGAVHYTFKVLAPLEKRIGAKDVARFAENLTPESEMAKLHAPVETFFVKRDRGAGRPTKKDRREMDAIWDGIDFSSAPFEEDPDDEEEDI